jgi:hypothetical protein
MVLDLGNIGYFCSGKSFVEGKNDNMATMKENMFLFKFVAISNKPLEIGKGRLSV